MEVFIITLRVGDSDECRILSVHGRYTSALEQLNTEAAKRGGWRDSYRYDQSRGKVWDSDYLVLAVEVHTVL